MREYGQIQSAFWQSNDTERMSDRAKLLACYLLTGPFTNGLGCFRVTDGNLTDDLGWPSETVSETLSELSHIGFAYRLGKVVFLPNFLRWNAIANPKVAIARLKELETLPTQDAKALASRALLKFCSHLTDVQKTVLQTISKTVSETVLQTLSKQDPTQPYPEPERKEREKTNSDFQLEGQDAGEAPDNAPAPAVAKPPTAGIEIDTWLDSLGDEDPIPEGHPMFAYAAEVGLPDDYLVLCWFVFEGEMRARHKRQKDWRAHFRNFVKRNYLRLWWVDRDGLYQLTTTGEQALREMRAKAKAEGQRDAA